LVPNNKAAVFYALFSNTQVENKSSYDTRNN
jgi:hypothetical protein